MRNHSIGHKKWWAGKRAICNYCMESWIWDDNDPEPQSMFFCPTCSHSLWLLKPKDSPLVWTNLTEGE